MAKIGTDIEKAQKLIQAGKLVGIPTDTVYGLAGDMMNESAVLNIFDTKERPATVPLIALSDSVEKLEAVTEAFDDEVKKLASKFWPGGLTIILNKKPEVSNLMTADLNTLGIRIPADPMALELLKAMKTPLAVTSANLHGLKSPITAEEVNDQLGDKIEYILEGGTCDTGVESSIIGIESGKIKLYRQGAISLDQLQQALS